MEKLKKITGQLSDDNFTEIESELISNKSENFLLLFRSYRNAKVKDEKLLAELNCKENAFYVLKSRLYDKIQNHLLTKTENVLTDQPINEHVSLSQYLYEYPRETALAILHKVEKQYEDNDIPEDLIHLYSILKKAYYYSDKYYRYSQLYNKQVAYTIALEKAEDILFNFNKTLANYYFSRAQKDKDLILVLLQEIENTYSLNKSHRLELIKNFIIIQILLFTDIKLNNEEQIEDLLEKCDKVIERYINDKQIGYFKQPLTFFKFEYCNKIKQVKKSLVCFDLLNENYQTWLLQNNTCLSFKFLLSRINVFVSLKKENELESYTEGVLFDSDDFYTKVMFTLYRSIAKFYNKKLAEATVILAELVNNLTLIDFLYIEIELKLTLAFFYFKQGEYQRSTELLKAVYRKVSKTSYQNAKTFIQLLDLIMNGKTKTKDVKVNKLIQEFRLQNTNKNRILDFLQPEINKAALYN
jgi:hypothetical protein